MPDAAPQAPPPDGPDADLIAYLDGELDGEAADRVEHRLALDPAARAAAEAYKKTFDLLDFLPKPDPSPDFAARTLTKAQPVVAKPAKAVTRSGLRPAAGTPSGTTSDFPGSAAGPAVRPAGRRWRAVAGWVVAAGVAGGGGYAAHAGFRAAAPARVADDLSLSDLRVIERLPLYSAVDDLDYLKRLDDPDLFAPGAAGPPPPARPDAPADPPAAVRDRLTELFRSFPPARRQQLRRLDQQFHDLPAADQDRLGRVLEAYALWAERLPDADRHDLLAAPTAADRLDAVCQLKEKAWREALPKGTRDRLRHAADAAERVQLAAAVRAADRARADEWDAVRRWDAVRGPDRRPWPFADPALAAQVHEYVRTVLKADPTHATLKDLPAGSRVTREEAADLKARYDAAERDGNWFFYGLLVHRLADLHPSLPEPGDKPLVTDMTELQKVVPPAFLVKINRQKAGTQPDRRAATGKWPEFAVEIAEEAKRHGATVPEALGPCKPGEFKPAVNAFVAQWVVPKLSAAERKSLEKAEGKFPDYPQLVVKLAAKHDEPIPNVMPPGKPSLWAKTYSLPAARGKN